MDVKNLTQSLLTEAVLKKQSSAAGRSNKTETLPISDSRLATHDSRLKKSCADFESVLLNYMFKSMKKTVGKGSVVGNSFQKDMYESVFFEKIAEKIARERGMGIGDALYRQLGGKKPD